LTKRQGKARGVLVYTLIRSISPYPSEVVKHCTGQAGQAFDETGGLVESCTLKHLQEVSCLLEEEEHPELWPPVSLGLLHGTEPV
jgi:hypothetical protein